MQITPRLLLIIDGIGDHPISELDNKTPLQAASLPVLDRLAKEGQCGIAHPIKPGIIASTVSGTLAILGYDPQKNHIGRGIVEAYGCGLELMPGDVAFRGNWATIDKNGFIIDRRAGRIREGTKILSESLNGLKIEDINFHVKTGTEHRIAIVLRGEGLNDQLYGSDPGDHFHKGLKPIIPHSIEKKDKNSSRTAKLLHLFELEALKILGKHPLNIERKSKNLLPANLVLTREPGKVNSFKKIGSKNKFGCSGIFITGDNTISGIAKLVGFDVCKTPSMTANLDTNLIEKFNLATKFLVKKQLVVLHIKGCDIAAHNKDPKNKKQFLEKIDSELGRFLEKWDSKLIIAITADHGTSSIKGAHIDDPVPILLNGSGIEADSVKGFDEEQVKFGRFGNFSLHELWGFFFRNYELY